MHVLRSLEQSHVWHHDILQLEYNHFPLYVHPDTGPLLCEPEETPSCVELRALKSGGGWEIHHILGIPGSSLKCGKNVPHHYPELSALQS